MRTNKTLSTQKENRTATEVVEEERGQYRQAREEPGATSDDLIQALRAVQEDARLSGLDKMSMREIDAEIAAARSQRTKESGKQPV
jgi:hypothetical protein